MALGDHVYPWRDTPIQLTELPALVYRDKIETKQPRWGICDNRLEIEIEISGSTPAEIRACLADLEKVVETDERWGGLALYSEFDINEMEIEQKENMFVASKVILVVVYRTVFGDPYTQA